MSLEFCLQKLENFENFAKENHSSINGIQLGNHQLIPIFDAVRNGLRRFVLAYGAGAGKTFVPLETIKQLQGRGKNLRVLVIAPKQAFLDNWNEETLDKYGYDMKLHHLGEKEDRTIPRDATFVTVNYDKLLPGLGYLDSIVEYASRCDLVIVDEFHNVKSIRAKTSRGYCRVIEASKDARLVALSATPCPDRLRDVGMMLYTIDPERYAHYSSNPFYIGDDPEALWEMREKGHIRFFDRESVADFHKLPEFNEREPIQVSMPQSFCDRYFEAFRDTFHFGKIHNLERIAIEALLNSSDAHEFIRDKIKAGGTLSFFSHLIHEPRNGTPDEAIFRQLESRLIYLGARKIRTIRGHTSDRERKEIQREMSLGHLDALINQWDCTSEAFSETTGSRPVTIIPLRSPWSPGRQTEIVGRSYRPGQQAPVEYAELHTYSAHLLERISSFVEAYAAENHVKVRSTWAPSLFHRDAYLIRVGKERAIRLLFAQRGNEVFDQEELDISSITQYARRLSKSRILDFSAREDLEFGRGTRDAMIVVGKDYEHCFEAGADGMGEDYNKKDILLYTPGKLNLFLGEAVERIKEREHAKQISWRIADLGCCSSAVFSQARVLYQTLESKRGFSLGFDRILNVDGNPGFVRTARSILERKSWADCVPRLRMSGFSEREMLEAKREIDKRKYLKNLEFKVCNFAREPIGNMYDAVVISQSLQYNDQAHNRDIEKITINVNLALRPKGHYLIALTGNSRKRSFTRERDVENLREILESYGFEVERCAQIAGKAGIDSVVEPFHYIQCIKKSRVSGKLTDFEDVPVVYSDTIEYLTGGYKNQRIRRNIIKVEQRNVLVPDSYIDENGEQFVI